MGEWGSEINGRLAKEVEYNCCLWRKNQNDETEPLLKTINQDSFLEIQEDLNLHIFHTRENQPRKINSETYPNKTILRFSKIIKKKSSGPSGKKKIKKKRWTNLQRHQII